MSDKKILIEQIKSQPEQIREVLLCCVIMPNGEIIYKGKSLGFYKNEKDFIFVKNKLITG